MNEGHAHDGRQFEALYDTLPADRVFESAALDKGDDAERIRARLAADGIAPVIPPITTRSKRLSDDQTRYRERNPVERFSNKLKQFRHLATHCDKLAKTFFAAVHFVAAFLVARNA